MMLYNTEQTYSLKHIEVILTPWILVQLHPGGEELDQDWVHPRTFDLTDKPETDLKFKKLLNEPKKEKAKTLPCLSRPI